MTDAELIEIVQMKSLPELTDAELKALRDRIEVSPELRQALAEHLEMERYLADALGQVAVSSERILARATQSTPGSRLRDWHPWAALALLLSIGLAAGLVWRSLRSSEGRTTPEDAKDGVAAVSPNAPQAKPRADGTAPAPARQHETAPAPTPPGEPKSVAVEPPKNDPPEAFALVDLSEAGWDEDRVKAWFDPVEGQPHGIRAAPAANSQGASTKMTGLWRLRPEWRSGSVLRCLFRTTNAFKFHVWSGEKGVTLQLWRGPKAYPALPDLTLAAYLTTRSGKEPLPETMVLAATDQGEFWRTRSQVNQIYGGQNLVSTPIDLRYENGLLTVSSGDVRILDVPFAPAVAEVYLEGEVSVQSLGFAPAQALPPLPAPLPTVLDVEKPAEQKWIGDLTALEKQADGSVELHGAKSQQHLTAATLLPFRGICETVVQLEGITPGTGVYLGDEKGQPRYLASFLRDEATGRTLLLQTLPTDEAVSVRFEAAKNGPPAFVGDKVWLRLRATCGQLHCWVSCDGTHWARAFEPLPQPAETWTSLGLLCQPGEPKHSIRLRRLMLRESTALDALAPVELVSRAPLVLYNLSLGEWSVAVQASRPPEVAPEVWARACALRVLSSGVIPRPYGLEALENLLDYGTRQSIPFADKVRLVDEALMLAPWSWDAQAAESRLARYYERLGQALQREGEPRPYSHLRQALYHNPLWSSVYAIDVFPEGLATAEMLDLGGAGKWEEAAALARIGRIHRVSPSIFDWAESVAAAHGHLDIPARKRPILSSDWQPTFVLESDKDSTTDLREMEAACGADLFRGACRIFTRARERGDRSRLVSDANDDQRLMSWPVALAGITAEHPDLLKTLRTEFAPEARLQLRQALDEKDVQTLEALALRYYGTEEAAEAHLWLADRHQLDGEPVLALARYREAQRVARGKELRDRIGSRLQLTAALLGRVFAAPGDKDIEFGATRLSPAALQALRKKRAEQGADSRTRSSLPPQLAPAPTAFEVVPHGRFDGEMGDKPEAVPPLPASRRRLDIDWFARQVAVTVDGNRLFVSNRFQVDCYELPSAKLLWRTALSREPARQEMPGPTYDNALTPMRPVAAGPHLFVRRLMRGPSVAPKAPPFGIATLACLEAATGKVVWSTTNHLTNTLHYVSDPLVIQDQVYALADKKPKDGDRSLVLLIHDRVDGRLLGERLLVSLRGSFELNPYMARLLQWQRNCQLTALEDGCLATVGDSVVCFDLAGNIRWARRPLWMPPTADPHWLLQPHDPPLVADGRCFIVQPGVLNLVCLAPESGQLYWQKAIAGLRRLAGLVGDRLVLQTDDGFVSLDAATGKERWRHEAPNLLSGTLCGGRGGLLYSASMAIPGEKDLQEVRLVWIDLETGHERAHFALKSQRHTQPRFGPLFVAGDRLWAFSGKGKDPSRDFLELAPKGPGLPATPLPKEWDSWTPTVSVTMRAAAARVLPGWTIFESRPLENIGLVDEFKGKGGVLRVAAPFCMARHLDVPAAGKPRLLLRVAGEAKSQCLIVVEVDGKRIWEQKTPTATSDPWKDWEVDLSAYQGKRVWMVVRQLPDGDRNEYCYWSKIALIE